MKALRHYLSYIFFLPDSERYVWRVDSFGFLLVSVGCVSGCGWFVGFGFSFWAFGGFLVLVGFGWRGCCAFKVVNLAR
jgi:hypothetical protein